VRNGAAASHRKPPVSGIASMSRTLQLSTPMISGFRIIDLQNLDALSPILNMNPKHMLVQE
jgi:hypothetical protein